MTTNTLVLLANGLVAPTAQNTKKGAVKVNNASMQVVGTVVANLIAYGYVPSKETFAVLNKMSTAELAAFWTDLAPAIKELTGANRQMDRFVVYKNFPKEVLDMSNAQYWHNQILMYWGLPNALFTTEAKPRPELLENHKLKVLALAKKTSLTTIFDSLCKNTTRWSDKQSEYARFLLAQSKKALELDTFGFKENGLVLIGDVLANKYTNKYKITTATDVLRLAAVLSGGDVALREKVRFKNFSRTERKLLLGILNKCDNLDEDFGNRSEVWKRFLSRVHPGDFSFKRVKSAYNALYNNNIQTFNKIVDGPRATSAQVIAALKSRPGEFVRRLHSAYAKQGIDAAEAFITVVPKLKTLQLVKLKSYIQTINYRTSLLYPPKGDWTKVQIAANTKKKFSQKAERLLVKAINTELAKRLRVAFPDGVKLDPKLKNVKLQTNDQKLAEYGRGTTFDIPDNINFIRSASYWAIMSRGYTWFDNGWNFFDENWKDKGVCAWNHQSYNGNSRTNYGWPYYGSRRRNTDAAAIFSGDPTNTKDIKGRACQMADLYIDKLLKLGVRYAVWNVLCFSGTKFSEADDVLATLQMGEKAEEGKLYEPARAQMVFPLKGEQLTSYVAYLDLVARKIVYMDAPLKSSTSSASANRELLSEKMPKYVEYLDSLPSVHDLLSNAKKGITPVLFSDENKKINTKKAYVFRPTNPNNKYDQIDLTDLLGK